MASTPRVPRYTVTRHDNPALSQDTVTDAVLKAICGLTSVPVGVSEYGFTPLAVGDFTRPAVRLRGYGLPVVRSYADMVAFNPYLRAGLEAAAHGPQQSEFTEAVLAFTEAAAALRDIAENTAKTLGRTGEADDTGEWNIKAAKEKLSQVFDQALVQPQRVTRRGGDAVILVEESRYNALTQAAASTTADMLDAFKAPALRGATLPEVTYPEPLAV